MADPTKVYTGAIPQGGYDSMQVLSTSSEAETSAVYGGPATAPKVVNQGGPTVGKTYNEKASQDFLLDSSYKTDMEVAPRASGDKVVNPDDISHADNC